MFYKYRAAEEMNSSAARRLCDYKKYTDETKSKTKCTPKLVLHIDGRKSIFVDNVGRITLVSYKNDYIFVMCQNDAVLLVSADSDKGHT